MSAGAVYLSQRYPIVLFPFPNCDEAGGCNVYGAAAVHSLPHSLGSTSRTTARLVFSKPGTTLRDLTAPQTRPLSLACLCDKQRRCASAGASCDSAELLTVVRSLEQRRRHPLQSFPDETDECGLRLSAAEFYASIVVDLFTTYGSQLFARLGIDWSRALAHRREKFVTESSQSAFGVLLVAFTYDI